MHPICPSRPALLRSRDGFTLIEAMMAIAILLTFFVTSTVALNFFNDRAARNRNAEAARAVVDDYVNYLLGDSVAAPAATGDGTDIDGDGTPDGVLCTSIPAPGQGRTVTSPIPLIVTRATSPTTVVNGTLYWRVQPVGKTYGCTNDTDIVQINFLLQYTYRNQTYYYKTMTFKAVNT